MVLLSLCFFEVKSVAVFLPVVHLFVFVF